MKHEHVTVFLAIILIITFAGFLAGRGFSNPTSILSSHEKVIEFSDTAATHEDASEDNCLSSEPSEVYLYSVISPSYESYYISLGEGESYQIDGIQNYDTGQLTIRLDSLGDGNANIEVSDGTSSQHLVLGDDETGIYSSNTAQANISVLGFDYVNSC